LIKNKLENKMLSIIRFLYETDELPSHEQMQEDINNFMKNFFQHLKKDAERKGEEFPKFKKPETILDLKKKPIEI